jgi:tRNA/rRNA methyltransferase
MTADTPSPLIANLAVVLVRTQGPVNLGLIARLCGNIGARDLRLVAPQCDVNCPDSRKFSTHSRDLLLSAPVFADLGQALADCGLAIGTSARERDANMGGPLTLRQLPPFLAARPAARWALVFGNEADGLNDEEMSRCQAFIQLETFGDNYSYNLSHAIAITLYTLACSSPAPRIDEIPDAAKRAEVDHLYDYWLRTLDRFQYFRRAERERFEPQLRRLVNRLHLSTHDLQMLWGMLAQFNYFTFGNREVDSEADSVD